MNKPLAALSAIAIAIAAAAPASAQPNGSAPPAKKGCEIQLKGPNAGQSVVYQHGYKFSIVAQDNKTHTYTCDDGEWKETVSLTAGGTRLGVAVPVGSVLVLAP
ncbi:MAG TPA: hypothetical protein VFZ00_14225 [Solirubrobacter sp.]|jgi:hypothetical protein|nr:hypothetical protein [Solirubrobacter sp.]